MKRSFSLLTFALLGCLAACQVAPRPRPPVDPERCTQDSDCHTDDSCLCGPCVATRSGIGCDETCGPSAAPVCERVAAMCDPTTHRCALVWTGRVGANPNDPADELRACEEEQGVRRPITVRPSRAGQVDPSRRPHPTELNWFSGQHCVTWPGIARSRVECPAGSRTRLPLVTATRCMQ